MATSKTAGKRNQAGSADYEARFQQALSRLSIAKPMPPTVQGNRSEPIPTVGEQELQRMTHQLFDEVEAQCAFYTERLGMDVMWVLEWLKKYWSAWSGGVNEDLVRETISEDCRYKDPLSFGRTMYGVQAFIDYNQAFYDAAPDLAYYLIPGEVSLQVSPKGEVIFMGRYVGCGHWDHPLRMYPFTPGSPAIPGTGAYIQGYPVDRYHLDPVTHKVTHGETLWDPFELLQIQKLMPSDTSLAFKAMVNAGKLVTPAIKAARRLPLRGGN
ncbi:nuclear transport factor 2 family protein [Nocardia sp. AB354]|uniref:nuclear transport factor 2 family protein n=1 Tax=Nocardia sp. AB354 TaxID=3413283 RepID=UPI003C183650